jgi:hypothetical protein
VAAGHAVRGMVTAWLGLVVLQTVSTKGGSGRVAALFGDVDRVLRRAFDPKVAAIPDRRSGATTPSASPASSKSLPKSAPVSQPAPSAGNGRTYAI